MGQADRGTAYRPCHRPRRITHGSVDERHQHTTMYDAIAIGVDGARDKSKPDDPVDLKPPKPAHVTDKPVVGVEAPACILKFVFHGGFVRLCGAFGKLLATRS